MKTIAGPFDLMVAAAAAVEKMTSLRDISLLDTQVTPDRS